MKYGNLAQKVAVVTGGARGIGEETARVLAEYGATVIAADINLPLAESMAKAMQSEGLKVYPAYVDVRDEASVSAMVKNTVEEFGSVDILVNNAGILDATPILEMTVEQWDRVLEIDLRGTHLCSQAVWPHMIKANYGKIINIASQAGQLGGFLSGVNYTAAKGGMLAITKAYARQGGAHNINVNAVSPGFMATEMTKDRDDNADTVPLQRLGTALDTAKAVYFLASDLSDYITGATIDLNGGYYMR